MNRTAKKRSKTVFEKTVLSKLSEYSSVDQYFFVEPLEHVLSGFFCEKTPTGAYVWRLIFPLFDPFETVHLSYSRRYPMPKGYIDFDQVPRASLAEEFVTRVRGCTSEARMTRTLSGFVHDMADRQSVGRSGHAQMVLGFAYVLLGDQGLATLSLSKAASALRSGDRAHCDRVTEALRASLNDAKNEVLEIELGVRRRLGLQPSANVS